MDFSGLYLNNDYSLSIKNGSNDIYKCWFTGELEKSEQNNDYIHFVTLSKSCFSENENQNFISIMVNLDSELPEWKIINNKNDPQIKNAIEFSFELRLESKDIDGTKIGGEPIYINTGHVVKILEPSVLQNNLKFIMQIDEEDFFPIKTPNIDKRIRDCLCGGVVYIFAKVDIQNNIIDFTKNIIDHQI
jgi:hypothetical protein